MAKIIAAYVANGVKRHRSSGRALATPAAGELALVWKRLYCLFSALKSFEKHDDPWQFMLFTDHAPPQLDHILIGPYLQRLGVKIIETEYFWRPDADTEQSDYFIFDALEHVSQHISDQDQLLLFGPQALVMHDIASLFAALTAHSVLMIEESLGEVSEIYLSIYREEMRHIRQALDTPCEPDSVMAINTQLLGLSGSALSKLMAEIKRIVPKNALRHQRNLTYLTGPSEILAAALASIGRHVPNMPSLSDEAAAMPDEFDFLSHHRVPVIVPGYGREPDISTLFGLMIPDSLTAVEARDPVEVMRRMALKSRPRSAIVRLALMLWPRAQNTGGMRVQGTLG